MKKIISKILHYPQEVTDYFTWDFRFSDGSFASNYRLSFGDFDCDSIDFVAFYGFQKYYFSVMNFTAYVVNY